MAIIVLMNIKNMLDVYNNFENYKILEDIYKKTKEREVIFLCVGNSKVWFDSFGPIVGSLLRCLGIKNFIYGNVTNNIIPSNINDYIENIYKLHTNPYIVVVDSAISKTLNKSLIIKYGKTNCSYLNKNSVGIGDLSITYNMTKEFIEDIANYKDMISNIRNLIRMIKCVFCC